MRRRPRPSRPGVTLVEVSAVLVIAAIATATVMPAMARTERARRSAGVAETARLAAYARDRAAASGTPTGLRADANAETLELLVLDDDGLPARLNTPLGQPTPIVDLASVFGLGIDRVQTPVGGLGTPLPDPPVIWFDHAGLPHARGTNGAFIAAIEPEATIAFESGGSVTVAAYSGLVEFQAEDAP